MVKHNSGRPGWISTHALREEGDASGGPLS